MVAGEQRSEEWYQQRDQLITASEAATALGLSSFESREEFIQRKRKCERSNAVNEDMHRGTVLEPFARDELQTIFNYVLDEGLVRHPTIPCIGASPDAIAWRFKSQGMPKMRDAVFRPYHVDMTSSDRSLITHQLVSSSGTNAASTPCIVEIKCPRKFKKYTESEWTVHVGNQMYVPITYWVQMQVQMACLDVTLAYFMNCNFSYNRELMCEYDPSMIEFMKSVVDYPVGVLTDVPYGPDMTAVTWGFKEYMIYPVHRDDEWLDSNLPKIVETYDEIRDV